MHLVTIAHVTKCSRKVIITETERGSVRPTESQAAQKFKNWPQIA